VVSKYNYQSQPSSIVTPSSNSVVSLKVKKLEKMIRKESEEEMNLGKQESVGAVLGYV
jgi:hypothetical protein